MKINVKNQISAGLKKEWAFFWRSFRLGGIIIVFLGCALFLPLMFGAMNMMGDAFEVVGEEYGGVENIPGMPDMGNLDMNDLFGFFGGNNGLMMAYTGSIEMFVSANLGSLPMGAMIVLILLMGTAGAEQKKRAIIIPQTAGLTVPGYVLPKFMLYPPMMFAATLISMFVVNLISHLVFGVSYPLEVVMVTGTLTGISMVFMVCLYLFLGLSEAQP